MKHENKSQSIISKLIVDFLLFSVFLLFFIGIIGPISEKVYNELKKDYLENELTDVPDKIKEGNYKTVETDEALGKSGFFYIYNEEFELEYREYYWSRDFTLTKEEIALIPYDDKKPIVCRNESLKLNDDSVTSLDLDYYNNMTLIESDYYILDDELNVIDTDVITDKKSFTESEISLLCGEYIDKYTVSKLEYINYEGKKYTAVLFRGSTIYNQIGSNYEGDEIIRNILLVILFIIAIIAHITRLYKIINPPLTKLNEGIDFIAGGDKGKVISYQGTEEFEKVFNNFNNMAIKLEESERKKNEAENLNRKIIADISHDLKTPITVIKGYTSAILDGKIEESHLNDYLIKIQNKTDGLNDLVETLNEYGKLNHPEFKLNLEYRDITEWAKEYFADKENELKMFNFKTDIKIPSEKIFCKYDELQMKRVVDNIISNTVRYTKQMTSVIFELYEEKEHVIMKIGDDGPGISEELKERIFEPFLMDDESRGEGSGLGMAIVKMIIDFHNGSINIVENRKGKFIYEIKIPKNVLEKDKFYL